MFVDTLHDILEGERASDLKRFMKQEVTQRLSKWGNGYMQLDTVSVKSKYIAYMKYVVNPFHNAERITNTLIESLPAILGNRQIPNSLTKVSEPKISDMKHHFLKLVGILVDSKVGINYITHGIKHQHEMQKFIFDNEIRYSIDATKRNIHDKASPLDRTTKYNISPNKVITAAQIFDSATTSGTNSGEVLIKNCASPIKIEKPYGLNGTFYEHYQGSIVQLGNRFDLYVLTKNATSSPLQNIAKCLFVGKRIPLQGRTKALNTRVQQNNFLNTVIIGTEGITDTSLNNGGFTKVSFSSKQEGTTTPVYYNTDSGFCIVRGYRGLSIKELTDMLEIFVGNVDPVMKNIAINTVFDWKRQQDSFQMVFSKMLNDQGMNHYVVTVDLLAFAFGIYYGTNVILQTGVSYYIYETNGRINRENITLFKNASNLMFRELKHTSKPNGSNTILRLNALLNAVTYNNVLQRMKLKKAEVKYLLTLTDVNMMRQTLRNHVNETVIENKITNSNKIMMNSFIMNSNLNKIKATLTSS